MIAPRCRPVLAEQRGRSCLAAILAEADHLAMHDIREHGPELLPFAALNFIESDVPRLTCHARLIPLGQKRLLGATRFPPAHAVACGRMTGGHRLTVDADLLPQAGVTRAFASANSMRSVRMPHVRQMIRRCG